MTKKWIVGLLVVAMLFSFAGVIGANPWGEDRPGGGSPFEVPPGLQEKDGTPPGHQVRDTVQEKVYRETVTDRVYTVGRRGSPPLHVWERWSNWGVGPPKEVLSMMDAKFSAMDAGKIKVKGNPLKSDVSPVITQGRTLVPIRAIAEAFGALVDWDEGMFLVIIDTDDTTILLKIGDQLYVVNDEVKEMDTTALLFQDRTMVPLRFVAEALGYNVHWDAATNQITIN